MEEDILLANSRFQIVEALKNLTSIYNLSQKDVISKKCLTETHSRTDLQSSKIEISTGSEILKYVVKISYYYTITIVQSFD